MPALGMPPRGALRNASDLLLIDLLCYTAIVAIEHGRRYYLRSLRLESDLRGARLHALEAQLRPHFRNRGDKIQIFRGSARLLKPVSQAEPGGDGGPSLGGIAAAVSYSSIGRPTPPSRARRRTSAAAAASSAATPTDL